MLEQFSDDPRFLRSVSNLVEGALLITRNTEVWIIKLNNWFDHKWLGFYGHGPFSAARSFDRLRLPSFHPNRIVYESYFSFDEEKSCYLTKGAKPLHPREFTGEEPWLDTVTTSGAMFWISGSTEANGRGSLYIASDRHTSGIRMKGIASVSFGKRPDEVMQALSASSISIPSDGDQPVAFARTVAKLGYVMAVAQSQTHLIEGDPYVLPAILGHVDDIGRCGLPQE